MFGLFISFLLSRASTTRAVLTHRQVSVDGKRIDATVRLFDRVNPGFPVDLRPSDYVLSRDMENDCGQNVGSTSGSNSKTQRASLVETRLVSAMERGPLVRPDKVRSVDGFEVQPCKERYHSASPIILVTSSANRSTLREGFSHAFPVVLPFLAHAGSFGGPQ